MPIPKKNYILWMHFTKVLGHNAVDPVKQKSAHPSNIDLENFIIERLP